MGRKWNEIVKLPEWQTPLGKLAFVVGYGEDSAFWVDLRRMYPACFSGEPDPHEGPVPWSAVETMEFSIFYKKDPGGVSGDALDSMSLDRRTFALTDDAEEHLDVPKLPPGTYAFREEFKHDGETYVVVTDRTVYDDGTVLAVLKDDVNWDA